MRNHPYLRAYMAGIVVPSVFMLLAPVIFLWSGGFPPAGSTTFSLASLTQLAIFPGPFVPNLWGLWNVLHLRIRDRLRIPHPAFGALIPLILLPLVRTVFPQLVGTEDALVVLPIAMAAYYLVWKFAVGFLNREMGIA